MKCPICENIELKSVILHNVEVDYCPNCLGLWFEREELRWAKDEKDENLRWLDIDLWKDEKKFKITVEIKLCPECRIPLYELEYGDSKVKVDLCNICQGIWLDRGEFKNIIDWLKEKANYEILNNYSKSVFKELKEVVSGPERLKEEILDFLLVLKLLGYKLSVQQPKVAELIAKTPK